MADKSKTKEIMENINSNGQRGGVLLRIKVTSYL